jgi:hypothetical protein
LGSSANTSASVESCVTTPVQKESLCLAVLYALPVHCESSIGGMYKSSIDTNYTLSFKRHMRILSATACKTVHYPHHSGICAMLLLVIELVYTLVLHVQYSLDKAVA